jgi:hypothetical protein
MILDINEIEMLQDAIQAKIVVEHQSEWIMLWMKLEHEKLILNTEKTTQP